MTNNELIELIQEAFKDVQLGNGIGLKQAQAIDDYESEEVVLSVRKEDEKINWQHIDPEMLDKCYSSLSFFDAEGMRFHIPAYIINDIKGLLQTADPSFHLWHGLDKKESDVRKTIETNDDVKWWNYTIERFSVLNFAQRNAIREYLKFKMQNDDFSKKQIERALKNFWNE